MPVLLSAAASGEYEGQPHTVCQCQPSCEQVQEQISQHPTVYVSTITWWSLRKLPHIEIIVDNRSTM